MKTKLFHLPLALLTLFMMGCQNLTSDKAVLTENIDIEVLYEDEIVLNYRELYNGDGEAMMEAILSDNFILYEDLNETFSIILIDVPLDEKQDIHPFTDVRMVSASGTVRSIEAGILSQNVATYKFKNSADITNEIQAQMAHDIVPKFEPSHHNLRFKTNGIEGQEFWFFAPAPNSADVGIHARVRTIVKDDTIYILRLIGMEDAIFGLEADRFFGSFNLK